VTPIAGLKALEQRNFFPHWDIQALKTATTAASATIKLDQGVNKV
jgi:hypothetical protein